jgi:hypothetical protein
MPKVKLDQLKEGMVVEQDVRNLDDMLILPAGFVLTERHISLLQSWGVSEVNVEAAGEEEAPSDPLALLPPETLARLTQETQARFWKYDAANPVEQEILRLVLRRKARGMTLKK